MDTVDATFNLLCILKEWEFPPLTREFPKKQTSLFEMDCFRLQQIVLIHCLSIDANAMNANVLFFIFYQACEGVSSLRKNITVVDFSH